MTSKPSPWARALTAATLLASTALASGCAAGQGLGALNAQADPVFALMGAEGAAASEGPGGRMAPGHHPLRRLLSSLGLDEAQKAQLRALMHAERQARPQASWRARQEELRALMAAPQLDAAALEGWLRAREEEVQRRLPERVALAGKLRAVLSPQQRTQLAEALGRGGSGPQAWGPLREAMLGRLEAQLQPTPAQREAWQALRAKLEAWRAREGAQHREALVRFVQGGQEEALAQAWRQGLGPSFPRQELLAVAQGLSLSQRQALMALASRRLRGGPHGPGADRPRHGGPKPQPQG